MWSADGETPLTLLKTTTEILVGTDLGFVYSFSTELKGDGSPLSASSAQRRFGVRDQRAIEGLALNSKGLLAHGGGLRRHAGTGSPPLPKWKLSTQVIELTGDHCERNRRAFKRFSGVSVKIQQAKDGLNGRTVPAVQPAMLRSSFSRPRRSLDSNGAVLHPLNRPPEIVSISVLAAGTRLESKTDSFDDSKGFTLPDIKLDDFVTDPQRPLTTGC